MLQSAPKATVAGAAGAAGGPRGPPMKSGAPRGATSAGSAPRAPAVATRGGQPSIKSGGISIAKAVTGSNTVKAISMSGASSLSSSGASSSSSPATGGSSSSSSGESVKSTPAAVLNLQHKNASSGTGISISSVGAGSGATGGGCVGAPLSRSAKEQLRLQRVARRNTRVSRLRSFIETNKAAYIALQNSELKLYFELVFGCCTTAPDDKRIAALFPPAPVLAAPVSASAPASMDTITSKLDESSISGAINTVEDQLFASIVKAVSDRQIDSDDTLPRKIDSAVEPSLGVILNDLELFMGCGLSVHSKNNAKQSQLQSEMGANDVEAMVEELDVLQSIFTAVGDYATAVQSESAGEENWITGAVMIVADAGSSIVPLNRLETLMDDPAMVSIGLCYSFPLIANSGSDSSVNLLYLKEYVVDVIIPPNCNYPIKYTFARHSGLATGVWVGIRRKNTTSQAPAGAIAARNSWLVEQLVNFTGLSSDGFDCSGEVKALENLIQQHLVQMCGGSGVSDDQADLVMESEGCVLGIKAYVDSDLITDYLEQSDRGITAGRDRAHGEIIAGANNKPTHSFSVDRSLIGMLRSRLLGTQRKTPLASEGDSGSVSATKQFSSHRFWVPTPISGSASGGYAHSTGGMLAMRQKLPAWGAQQSILTAVESHHAVIITGETGSGKTTQTPQFLYEHHQGNCRILICQPRRLAATSVAQRVAEEMGTKLGDTVGYMIKGDVKASPQCQIVFCTYGVLLRRLQGSPSASFSASDSVNTDSTEFLRSLAAVDYVILDEVHERGSDSDLVLALLRNMQLARNYPAADREKGKVKGKGKGKGLAGEGQGSMEMLTPLKLIVMSATIATERIAKYLVPCSGLTLNTPSPMVSGAIATGTSTTPIICIPGRTFSVHEYFRNDYESRLLGDMAATSRPKNNSNNNSKVTKKSSKSALNSVYLIGGPKKVGDIDYDLLTKLILQLAGCGELYAIPQGERDGSTGEDILCPLGDGETILVFMPGVAEIQKCIRCVEQELAFYQDGSTSVVGNSEDTGEGLYDGCDSRGGTSVLKGISEACKAQMKNIKCICLHGNLSHADQQVVFKAGKTAGSGARKKGLSNYVRVVVSTNVAEVNICTCACTCGWLFFMLSVFIADVGQYHYP